MAGKTFRRKKALKTKVPKCGQKNKALPVLTLRSKLLLYSAAITLSALSVTQVIYTIFPDAAGIAVYILAALMLTASCCYLAADISYCAKLVKRGIEANAFTGRLTKDYRYRTMLFAIPGLILNLIFAIFNGVIGIASHSPWFGTLSAYYILLSIMRFWAVRYDKQTSQFSHTKKQILNEIIIYKKCGIMFIVMTAALCGAVILLLSSKGGKQYPGFTIYAVAAYTFYKVIISVINMLKAGKLKSPILMTVRSIGYIDACVSVLSLQTAMFAAFSKETKDIEKLMNGITGIIVCLIVLSVGVSCILSSRRMKLQLETGGIVNDSYTCSGR